MDNQNTENEGMEYSYQNTNWNETQQNTINKSERVKSNVITGIIGAFIGSLVGVAVWVFIYNLGYIAAISGLIMTICVLTCYDKLSGKLDRKGVIISFIIVIVMIYMANRICYATEIYKAYKDYGYTPLDSFKAVSDLLTDSEIRRSFYFDLALGYVFGILGSFRRFAAAFREVAVD